MFPPPTLWFVRLRNDRSVRWALFYIMFSMNKMFYFYYHWFTHTLLICCHIGEYIHFACSHVCLFLDICLLKKVYFNVNISKHHAGVHGRNWSCQLIVPTWYQNQYNVQSKCYFTFHSENVWKTRKIDSPTINLVTATAITFCTTYVCLW